MDISKYDESIIQELNFMEENRFSDPSLVIKKAKSFLELATEKNDMNLIGYADFYLGDCYYTLGNITKCIEYTNSAIQEFTLSENWYKAGGCYNLLGIVFSNQGDTSNALTSYFEAISLAERHGDSFVGSLAYENYAEMCESCNINDYALENALKSKELILKCRDNSRFHVIYTLVLATILKIYLKTNDIDNSILAYEDLMNAYDEKSDLEHGLDFYVVQLLYANKTGLLDEEQCLKEALESFDNNEYKTDYFMYVLDLMRYLKDNNRYETLGYICSEMDKILDEANYPAYKLKISDIKIDYLQHENKKNELFDALIDYRKYFKMQENQNSVTLNYLAQLRDSLAVQKNNIQVLQEKVVTDELTGIHNRRRFAKLSKQLQDKARQNHVHFAIEMLDIDKFKQINDRNGHRTGDLCLNAIGQVLQSLQDDNIYCYRYGGDEFSILFYNYTDEQIREICNKLSERVKDVFIIKRLPLTTISQGICNIIPSMKDSITSQLASADKALYESKGLGGNKITIIN
ncbi:MAG: GGDEF domain-containing protein [Butyrivibrio sp.]|nr:GGDEF domain-containing protein [Butyrivibrio sp.]